MKGNGIQSTRRTYASWLLLLAALLCAGVGANVALHRRVRVWRELNPAYHWAEADRLVREGDYVGARLELERARELAPDRREPYEITGHLHYDLKQWEKALAAYRKAIEKGGRDPHLYGRVMWCLMHLRRHDEAAEVGLAALERGLDTPNLRRYIGEAYRRAGKPEQAISFFEAALTETPNSIDLMNNLVAAYRAAGREQEADELAERIDEAQALLQSVLDSEDGTDPRGAPRQPRQP